MLRHRDTLSIPKICKNHTHIEKFSLFIEINYFMPSLNWIGKEQVVNHHHAVPFHILEKKYDFGNPSPRDIPLEGEQESGNLQSTLFKGSLEERGFKNKIIHGDNLEALKSLLPEYEGKIKCIYIDPPYNTGNENWVYNDNVNHPKIKKWLGEVVGKEGEDLSRHDKWLCMMYPRLKLLHKLLREDGVIFISIDDNEQANLKLIMDEIFGSNNFVANIIWQKRSGGGYTNALVSNNHEYLFAYAKKIQFVKFTDKEKEEAQILRTYNYKDEKGIYKRRDLRKSGSADLRADRPTMFYKVIAPDGSEIIPIRPRDKKEGRWSVGETKYFELLNNNDIEFVQFEDSYKVYIKERHLTINEEVKTEKYETIWTGVYNTHGTNLVKKLFPEKESPFDYPKPVELIEKILKISTKPNTNDIILDSFAGSGTTAHAVLNLNRQDGGNRKFILIEMEDYAETITAERVKRVMKPPSPLKGESADQPSSSLKGEQKNKLSNSLAGEQNTEQTPPKGGWGAREAESLPKVFDSANKALYEKLKIKAQEMRYNPTQAEALLWDKLKNNLVIDGKSYKFRRQHIIERYIADFYCLEAGLIIELDGGVHDTQLVEDKLRQEVLESLGCKVIRFPNEIVLNDIDYVINEITNTLNKPSNSLKGEQENETPPLGGWGAESFSFYELGERIFDDSQNLNEKIGIDKIREYVYFTETREQINDFSPFRGLGGKDNPYYMGEHNNTGYYFYYEKDQITDLDYKFLATMSIKADSYIIYADICTLSQDFMREHYIIFKKIPRDIAKL